MDGRRPLFTRAAADRMIDAIIRSRGMRRSFLGPLLVALAVLSRLLMPLAAEARAADPLANVPICMHDGNGMPVSDGNRDGHAHELCLMLCCHVVPPLADATPRIASPTTVAALVEWDRRVTAIVVQRALDSHRARGPPALSPT